jgi:hypothetical protein
MFLPFPKDNIILSLLHVFRLLNQSPTGEPITIFTIKGDDSTFQKKATLGNLLVEGEDKLSSKDHFLTETVRVGFKDGDKCACGNGDHDEGGDDNDGDDVNAEYENDVDAGTGDDDIDDDDADNE